MADHTIPFLHSTQKIYDDALGALPPEVYGTHGFLLGEPITHRRCRISGEYAPTFEAHCLIRGQFYVSADSVTVKEFEQLTVNDVLQGCEIGEAEKALRLIWHKAGIPIEKQDALIAELAAKAQPGAMVGPFVIQDRERGNHDDN